MTEVRTTGGQTVDVAPEEAQYAYQKGRAEFSGRVELVRGNEVGDVASDDLPTALAQGWQVASPEQQRQATVREEERGLVGDIRGGLEAGARGLTGGLSDPLLTSLGADPERMRVRKEQIGGGAQLLEVAGGLTGVGALAGRGAARLGAAALGESGLARVATGTFAGGLEAGLAGAGQEVSEAALGDRELAAEQVLSGFGKGFGVGSLFGAGATTLGIGLERAYTGSQRVGKQLLERAVGAGDDATSTAGRSALNGDSVISTAARKQVRMLGGTDAHVAAAERALGRTRTAAGRRVAELARGPAKAIDDAVGARLKTTLPKAGGGKAVKSWAGKIKASSGGRKMLAKQAGEAAQSMRGVQGKGAARVRQLLRAESRGIKDYKSYSYGRSRLQKTLRQMEDAGDPALAQARSAAQPYLDAGTEAMVWGPGVAARDAVQAGQAAEKAALGAMGPKARKALTGGEIDDATARALAREPGVDQVLTARSKVADALEGVGEDVTELRRGIDDVRQSLKYRDEVAAATDDFKMLDELEAGPGGTARKVLEYGGEAAGAILGGLTFGGAALGKITGSIAGAATRPASAIRMIARVRGGLDAVRARQGAAVDAFARAAEKTGKAARRGARGAARAAPRVAPAAARAQQRKRIDRLSATVRRATMLAADPMALADEMDEATRELRVAAPNLTNAVVAGAARAAAYVKTVAPVPYVPMGMKDVELYDPFELDAFERRLEAVEDPVGTTKKLADGSFSREHAEAMRVVWPKMFAELQEQIIERVGDKPISFDARVQLGLFGSIVTDESLRSEDFEMIQGSMAPAPFQPPPPSQPSQMKPPPLSKWQRMESGS